MKVYEIIRYCNTTEVHYVKAKNEEEAVERVAEQGVFHKSYDGDYNDLVHVSHDEGPWELADFIEQNGDYWS